MYERLTFEHDKHSKDPVLSCALEGVASVIAGISNVSIVIHSPQGCAATVGAAYDIHEVDFTKRKIGCTRLFESDIIMGATDKLKKIIRQSDEAFQTKVMFVVGTCSADIIGEDIEAVCRSMQDEVNALLIPVTAGGFRGNSYTGIDLGLEALYTLINHSVIKMVNTVNIIAPQSNANPTWQADIKWVTDILTEMGIGVQTVFSHETSLEQINAAGMASANILLSHEAGRNFAAKLEESHNIPLILSDLPMPVGMTNTNRWIRAVGEYFGRQEKAESIIAREEEKVIDILRKRALMMIPRYRNCKIAFSGDTTIGIGILRMLFEELEMIPETLIYKYCSPHAKMILEKELKDMKISPKIVFEADGYRIKEALKFSDADLVIGSSWEKYMAEELDFKITVDLLQPTNREVYINEAYFGYTGMLNILQVFANDWERALRSKHIQYKECTN